MGAVRPTSYERVLCPVHPTRTKTSLWWALQSRNKKLVTLNLGHPDGLDLARRLATESDILVENFKPGTLEKLGLGWEVLHELKPRLILVRVSGRPVQGQARVRQHRGGDGRHPLRHGRTGPAPGSERHKPGRSLASLYAVIGALMAVHARDVQGRNEGQVVDVALYEAVFSLMESMVPEYDVADIERERTGAALPGIAPSNSCCSSDGSYVAIDANSDAIFKRLTAAVGRPDQL